MKRRALTVVGQEKTRLNGLREWLEGAGQTHGTRFDYAKARAQFHTQKSAPVDIFCRDHRLWFKALPFNHLRSKSGGCKHCDQGKAIAYFRSKEFAKFNEWLRE